MREILRIAPQRADRLIDNSDIVKWPRFARPNFAFNKLRSGSAGLVRGAAVTAPAIQALESALRSHLCVAISSAQVQIL